MELLTRNVKTNIVVSETLFDSARCVVLVEISPVIILVHAKVVEIDHLPVHASELVRHI
jgi:hypothetical protein